MLKYTLFQKDSHGTNVMKWIFS